VKAPEKAWLWEGLAVLGSVAGNLVLFQAARTGRKWTRKEEETHFHVVRSKEESTLADRRRAECMLPRRIINARNRTAFTDPAAPGVVNVLPLGTALKSRPL
jgi:hypothetical protein